MSQQLGVAELNAALDAEALTHETSAARRTSQQRELAEYPGRSGVVRDEAAPHVQVLDRFRAYISADTLPPPI